MINPPTDRLHKFVALAGIALILLSINISTTKYHEARMRNIEAKSAVERIAYAQREFARGVNELLEIERRVKGADFEFSEPSVYKEQLIKLNPEVTA